MGMALMSWPPFVYEKTEAHEVRNAVLSLYSQARVLASVSLLNSSPQPRLVQAPPRPARAAARLAQPITRGARRCA